MVDIAFAVRLAAGNPLIQAQLEREIYQNGIQTGGRKERMNISRKSPVPLNETTKPRAVSTEPACSFESEKSGRNGSAEVRVQHQV